MLKKMFLNITHAIRTHKKLMGLYVKPTPVKVTEDLIGFFQQIFFSCMLFKLGLKCLQQISRALTFSLAAQLKVINNLTLW